LPYTLAQQSPERLFVGIDASVTALGRVSGRALRARLTNLLYVRAAVEDLPLELARVADRVMVVLPWGSLLAAVALPRVGILRRIRALCQPGAVLTVVLGIDPDRDRGEIRRLGLPPLTDAHLHDGLTAGYAEAGFTVTTARSLGPGELARWPSTWARRFAHGRPRSVWRIDARVPGGDE
jgi:16S rRNA (adenine(1408)-N(1))-methyltransferase